jgi:tetratricopeptide (TPR) repeat protein
MTMNYCGRCGAANGTAARFCRQCGVELHNQAAFSSTSSPLNVEFSAHSAPKERQREEAPPRPAPPTPPPFPTSSSKIPAGKIPVSKIPAGKNQADRNGEEAKDPKAISESLKRLRASGPLMAGAAKKKQERINQIIAESTEGQGENKSKTKGQTESPPPPLVMSPTTPPVVSPANQIAPQAKTKPAAAIKTQANSSAFPVISGSSATNRKQSMQLPAPAAVRGSGALTASGQLPPHGPSSVLAQASGLGKPSNFGSKLRLGLIAAIVVLSAGGYFLLRDRWAGPVRTTDAGRNLLSAEEKSAEFVRLGQREREQGHYDDAIGLFNNALILTPKNPDIHFLLAQTHNSAGQTDEALKNYQALLRITPDHLEARLQVAQINHLRGNWNAALQEYQRIIALDQNSPQAAVALAAMETQGVPETETVAVNLPRPRSIARKTPVAVALPVAAAQARIPLLSPGLSAASGIKPPANPNSRIEESPDPRAAADGHKKLGLRYFNVREYHAAIKEFLSALRMTPADKDIYYFLGSSYYGLGQQALAHDYYKRVDTGNYVGVAQSGAARTEKAAREEFKRRETLKNDPQNQVKNEADRKGKNSLNNSLE